MKTIVALVRRIALWWRACRHCYEDVGCNGFYLVNEQRCRRCGAYRHKILKAENMRRSDEGPWQPGKHPLNKN